MALNHSKGSRISTYLLFLVSFILCPFVSATQHTSAHQLFSGPSPLPHAQSLPPSVGGIDTLPASASRRSRPVYAYKPSTISLDGFCHPLKGKGKLSQGIRGVTHQGRMEYAYDLAVPIGTPVYAMRSGEVLAMETKYPDSGGSRSRGEKTNYVLIQHPGGYRSAYVHLQQRSSQVTPGTWVKQGQLIAFSGNSGWTSGPHLHVEVQKPSPSQNFVQTVPFSIRAICAL